MKRQKPGPKGRSKGHQHRKQCNNPDCRFEARPNSIYCSDDCGLVFNKLRYDKYFLPKIDYQNKAYRESKGREYRMKRWGELDVEKKKVIQRINELKLERDELVKIIDDIKEEATKLYKPKISKDKETDQSGDIQVCPRGMLFLKLQLV